MYDVGEVGAEETGEAEGGIMGDSPSHIVQDVSSVYVNGMWWTRIKVPKDTKLPKERGAVGLTILTKARIMILCWMQKIKGRLKEEE